MRRSTTKQGKHQTDEMEEGNLSSLSWMGSFSVSLHSHLVKQNRKTPLLEAGGISTGRCSPPLERGIGL